MGYNISTYDSKYFPLTPEKTILTLILTLPPEVPDTVIGELNSSKLLEYHQVPLESVSFMQGFTASGNNILTLTFVDML